LKHLNRHLSFANAISCIALFVALSGAAFAAKTTLGNKAVKTRNLANGSVTTPKLRGGAVTSLKLRNGAVTGPKIAPGAVGSTQIANGAVRSAALGGGVVTEGKLKNGAVTETKLFNSAVTNSKIGPNAVATGKIADGAVTSAKLATSLLTQLVKNVSYEFKASALSDSSSPKSATAQCPSGKVAIGGGAKTTGTATKVALTESAPTAPDGAGKRTGWTVTASELDTDGENWAVEAYVVCAEL
jgi:hypothetical protein